MDISVAAKPVRLVCVGSSFLTITTSPTESFCGSTALEPEFQNISSCSVLNRLKTRKSYASCQPQTCSQSLLPAATKSSEHNEDTICILSGPERWSCIYPRQVVRVCTSSLLCALTPMCAHQVNTPEFYTCTLSMHKALPNTHTKCTHLQPYTHSPGAHTCTPTQVHQEHSPASL